MENGKPVKLFSRYRRISRNGLSRTREYSAWRQILHRCMNPKCKAYSRYGGRGITVCKRWIRSFIHFYKDMGSRPSLDHSVERRDNEGPYSPANCYWALPVDQSNNRRSNHRVRFNGRSLTLAQWSRKTDIPLMTIRARLEAGWSIKKALSVKVNKTGFMFNGGLYSLAELSRLADVKYSTMYRRIVVQGWPIEKAIGKKVV